jgi:hypothetical protein
LAGIKAGKTILALDESRVLQQFQYAAFLVSLNPKYNIKPEKEKTEVIGPSINKGNIIQRPFSGNSDR